MIRRRVVVVVVIVDAIIPPASGSISLPVSVYDLQCE